MLQSNDYKKIDDAKQVLKEYGYYVENLWNIDDVKGWKECTDKEAYDILDTAMNNEETNSQIWSVIEYCLANK